MNESPAENQGVTKRRKSTGAKPTSVYFDAETEQALGAYCEQRGVKKSTAVKGIVQHFLDPESDEKTDYVSPELKPIYGDLAHLVIGINAVKHDQEALAQALDRQATTLALYIKATLNYFPKPSPEDQAGRAAEAEARFLKFVQRRAEYIEQDKAVFPAIAFESSDTPKNTAVESDKENANA